MTVVKLNIKNDNGFIVWRSSE